jgi:catechol 2,3-dioxygenase-like lactoylglutathione lyase family enzyme
MARIKHIAIATQHADETARFYIEVMGLKQVGIVDNENASGYYLSDGHINLAILDFKHDQPTGVEYGAGYSGIHHFGFEVDSLAETQKQLEDAGVEPRHDINAAFNFHTDTRRLNVEMKYAAPDGVIMDISETGWVGTHPEEQQAIEVTH